MSRIIKKKDYELYLQGEASSIDLILDEIFNKIRDNLKNEARSKGFEISVIDRRMDLINLRVNIPNASEELKNNLASLDPFIICE